MDKIKFGKIVNTHGLKGELKLAFSDLDLLEDDELIFINYRDELVEFKIISSRMHKNHLLITLDGYNNINDVQKYLNCDVYVNKKAGEIYLSELISFDVFENDVKIGTVKDIIFNGAQDILVLDNNVMIPNISEFVKDIDLENNVIKVELIEGFVDEH